MKMHAIRRIAIPVAGVLGAMSVGISAAAAIDMMTTTPNTIACADLPEAGPDRDPGNCRTENRSWTYYMDSSGTYALEDPDRTAATAGMQQWENATVMDSIYDSTPVFSGTGETDVIFQEGATAFTWADGVTWCVDITTAPTCDSFYLRIRGAGVYTKPLVAHEAGHTLGLTHGSQAYPATSDTASIMGIMTTGTLPTTLGSEPVAQVNNFY